MTDRPRHFHRRGFSLIEVLLATFILAIGLIMVATIFPVGADWTRQATEDTVAQAVAVNAVTLIKNRYFTPGGVQSTQAGAITSTLQGLPGLTNIPIAERTYQFGNTYPFPSRNARSCTYYWTALARISPAQVSTVTRAYDIYILVFRKGDPAQTFYESTVAASNYPEVVGARDTANPTTDPTMDWHLEPTLVTGPYAAGTYDATQDPPISGAIPPVGYYGIGATSGTVFRQVTAVDVNNPNSGTAIAKPNILGQTASSPASSENVIFAPPADGTNASPLVYVFQTTLTF